MRAHAPVVFAAVLGCAARERRTADDTLVVLVDIEVGELDPRFVTNATQTKVSGLIASGLTTVDTATLEPRLDLAQAVEQADPLTWNVTLRPDARFSSGAPVTADDVIFTFQSVMDPVLQSPYRRAFADRFVALERIDEGTVRFRLKQPIATFMTDLDFGIVQKSAAEALGGRFKDGTCIGAGPYAVVSMASNEVVLERSLHHPDPPAIPRVVIRTVRDDNARLLMLVGGSADLAQNTIRPDIVDDVASRPRLEIATTRSAMLTYLMCNNEDPILRDVRVRRAIAHAIFREELVRARFGGRAVLATGLLMPGHWAYTGDVTRYDYDPDLSRRLLDEAGWPDPDGPGLRPRFRLTYKTSAVGFRVGVARLIAQQLGEVGIAVDVRPFEFATFFSDIKRGSYQLASMQTAEVIEPDMYWGYFHSSRIPSPSDFNAGNRWRYRSPEVDALIEAGRFELVRERRKAIYAQIQRRLAADLPIVPLWHEDNVAVMHRDVDGYELVPNARLSPIARATKR